MRHLCGTKVVEAGYSPHSAAQAAWSLMQRPEIREAVAEGQARRVADGELSASRVLEELRRVAFADVRSLYDEQGRLRPVTEWTPEDAAALAQFEVATGSGSGGDGRPDRVLKVRMNTVAARPAGACTA